MIDTFIRYPPNKRLERSGSKPAAQPERYAHWGSGRRSRVAMMGRTVFGIMLGFGLFCPIAADAQQAVDIPRIGYVSTSFAANPKLPEAFRQGLRDLGYVEGRNVVIEYRSAEGLPALVTELVALKVDVIVAANTRAALAAKQATRTTPIVFAGPADPGSSGLVHQPCAARGGNVTGLSSLPTPEQRLAPRVARRRR